MLEVTLLGSPEVRLHGQPVTGFRSSKAQALFFYLALARRPVQRGTLVGLLWADQDESQARVNLNQTLSNLRKLLGDYIDADRQSLRFVRNLPHHLDVEHFATVARRADQADLGALTTAADAYRGDFLEGFFVRDCAEFEDWLAAERSHLRESAIYLLTTASHRHVEVGDLARAVTLLRRLLRIEPWREPQQRNLMMLLAQRGERAAALAQFELCREALVRELDVEPAPETVALLEEIRRGALAPTPALLPNAPPVVAPPTTPSALPASSRHNLPADVTPFVGRTAEIARIVEQLRDPGCRLLTLVGPGGVGKSRLAVQVMRTLPATSDDGCCFVPLAPVETPEGMVGAIAQALGFQFYENAPPRQQLLDYLCEKRLLLVLDNLEHLRSGLDLVTAMLAAAPALRILATSREALNLVEEWYLSVGGLTTPRVGAAVDATFTDCDAVQLFVQSARRAQTSFALTGAEHEVARICQIVDGTPLAIELAAAWLRVLPIAQIASEIERNLDLLTARHQNMPARHRSMRAILESSWRLLPAPQRAALRVLAVCPGDFDAAAAQQIADASLFDLAMLVEKSLLRTAAVGRYTMHSLLRQFAQERLAAHAQEDTARSRHSGYYLQMLAATDGELSGAQQHRTLERIDAELDNLRAAWLWAVEQGEWATLQRAAAPLYDFLHIRSHYADGQFLFARAAEAAARAEQVHANPSLRACCLHLRVWLGAFHVSLGDYAGAEAILAPALMDAHEQGFDRAAALAASLLGQMAGWSGDRLTAQQQMEASRARSERSGDWLGVANALHKLAQLHAAFGDYAEARTLAEASLHLCQHHGRPDWAGYALDVLAWSTFALGDYLAAEAHYLAALTVAQESGDRLGAALALGGVGSVAWAHGQARLAEAASYLEESLALCRDIGHRAHMSSRLWYLAQIANDTGDHRAAQEYAREGLAVAETIGSRVFMSYNLCALGDAACGLGEHAVGERYLLAVLRTASETDHLPPIMIALVSLGRLWSEQSRAAHGAVSELQAKAVTVLTFARSQPACWHCFRTRADCLLGGLAQAMTPKRFADAQADAAALTPPTLVAALLQQSNVASDRL